MKTLLVNDTSNENHIGCQAVIDNIYKLSEKNGFDIQWTLTRDMISCKNGKSEVTIANRIKEFDYIIINGEGSLHDSPPWFYKFMNIVPDNTKCVLINSLWQNMSIDYLYKLDLISVRESYSYNDLINRYSQPEKIIITPDMMFYSDLSDSKIGYGDSVDSTLQKAFSKCHNYYPLQFHNNLPSLTAYKSWLNSLEIYITGRFHGVCVASMSNAPFLALPSNSHKIEGILEDMNCPELLIPNFLQWETKKEVAKESIIKAHSYAKEAKRKIEDLFKRMRQI